MTVTRFFCPPLLALVCLLTACAPFTQQQPPTQAEITQNSAVQSLYHQAQEDRHAGRVDKAEAALERAVRIEPANPHLWFELAQLSNDKGAITQARGLAQRAQSLARGDLVLSRQINQFLSALE